MGPMRWGGWRLVSSARSGGASLAITDPFALIDGRANAPAGTPQYPNLLNLSSATNGLGRNLAVRPPWKAAGVDYHVGIDRNLYPTNANLKDPTAGGLPAGVSFAGTTVTVTSTSAVTLDGWDFSVGNGLQVFIKGVINGGGGPLTISNCNFKIGTNNNICINSDRDAGALTLVNVEMDGNGAFLEATFGASGQGTLISVDCTSITVLYNWWHDAWEDGYDPVCDSQQHQTMTFKYNLFDTCSYDATAHSDWVQINNFNDGVSGNLGHTDNFVALFNVNYQRDGTGHNQQSMFRLNTQVDNSEIGWNTAVTGGSTAQSNTFFDIVEASGVPPSGDDPSTIANSNVHDNYCLVDTFGHVWFNGFYTTFPTLAHGIVNPTETGNIDMSTGSQFPVI